MKDRLASDGEMREQAFKLLKEVGEKLAEYGNNGDMGLSIKHHLTNEAFLAELGRLNKELNSVIDMFRKYKS